MSHWKETSPGLWERPLGAGEAIMVAAITGARGPREPVRIHNIVNFTAPFSTDEVTRAFRESWKALRLLKEPDIATSFGEGKKRYRVTSPQGLEAWLDETFTIAKEGTTVQSVVRELQNRLVWLPLCYILPESVTPGFKGSLIVFASHWRVEAGGVYKIIDELFDYAHDILTGTSTRDAISQHVLGTEADLLTPSMEDMLMPNTDTSLEAKARVEKHFADHNAYLPCIDFPIKANPGTKPSYQKANQRTYNVEATARLIDACKIKDLSITSAVHAAYLGAVWKVADPQRRNRSYASIMPANVRTRLSKELPYREQGFWSGAQMLMLYAPANEDFLTTAKRLRRQYELANQKTWLHEDMRYTHEMVVKNAANYSPEPTPLAQPYFTSLGVLDRDALVPKHGDLKISKVAAWADPTGPGIVLTMWSFSGRLNHQISWNAAFHADEQIQAALNDVENLLCSELAVKMVTEDTTLSEF